VAHRGGQRQVRGAGGGQRAEAPRTEAEVQGQAGVGDAQAQAAAGERGEILARQDAAEGEVERQAQRQRGRLLRQAGDQAAERRGNGERGQAAGGGLQAGEAGQGG